VAVNSTRADGSFSGGPGGPGGLGGSGGNGLAGRGGVDAGGVLVGSEAGAGAEAGIGAGAGAGAELVWYVAHVRPRCEKKLAEYCQRAGVVPTLPLYRSIKKYRGKTVVFEKPLFPGYVFLRMPTVARQGVMQSDYVANLLDVPVQDEFEAQLGAILQALETEYEVRLSPTIQPGCRVKIRTGPLRGLEGYVEERRGMVEVHLRLAFIGQAAAVRMDADMLELV